MMRTQAETGLRVLVVEADAALTEMMSELLAREGCAVTGADSVQEAMSRLRDGPVDMVIFDVDTVPLRARRQGPAWPAWMIADSGHPQVVIVSVQAPAPDRFPDHTQVTWLPKPFRNEEFLSTVRPLAAGKERG
jgi:CheY-like chemotaxis protein